MIHGYHDYLYDVLPSRIPPLAKSFISIHTTRTKTVPMTILNVSNSRTKAHQSQSQNTKQLSKTGWPKLKITRFTDKAPFALYAFSSLRMYYFFGLESRNTIIVRFVCSFPSCIMLQYHLDCINIASSSSNCFCKIASCCISAARAGLSCNIIKA